MKQLLRITLSLLILGACSPAEKTENATPPATVEKTTMATPPVVAEEEPDNSALTPLQSIQDLDKKIEAYSLGENLTDEQKQTNQILKAKIIRGTFDIAELCRLAMAKHWAEVTPEEQAQVVTLMTSLLEKKAIFSKERLSGRDKYYQIQYLSEEIDKQDPNQALVKTRLVVAKRDLRADIHYKMIKSPKGWKIFDVIVDESSMLLNYRSAFHNIITKYGFPELLTRMRNKLDEIK